MSEKKRKRKEQGSERNREKKTAAQGSAQNIRISHIDSEQWAPVLASTPGLSLPKDVSFAPFSNSDEILLHSSQHPRLDYIAREEPSNGVDSQLHHYIGIFDPEQKVLQLVPAKHLVARSTLRHTGSEDISTIEAATATGYAARNNLGLAFGTKKSQKAIRSLTENAINATKASPSKSKSDADGSQNTKRLDALSEAVLSSMAEPTSSMPSREEMQAQIDEAKPIPHPHLDASNASEVYPVAELVGGEHVLRKLQVKDWIETLNAGGDVPTQIFFVSRRLAKVAHNGDVLKMRILKYLCLLVGWWKCLKPGRSLKVPRTEELGDLVAQFGTELVTGLGRRFSKNDLVTKWYRNYILTHILALALTVDNFNSDTNNIRVDLKLEMKELKSLYRELGCPLRAPTETELKQLKITKAEGAMHQYAQVKLPLEFPKTRAPARRR